MFEICPHSPMKDFHLLLLLAFSLAIAFITLAFRENFLANPTNHDWWSISFASEKTIDGDFSVSNFGATKTFFYEVWQENVITESASFTIGDGNGQTIIIENPESKPIRIIVWTDGDVNKESKELGKRKEIYKRMEEIKKEI